MGWVILIVLIVLALVYGAWPVVGWLLLILIGVWLASGH